MLQQIEKLGLTIDQYLQSLKTDVEKIKAEYRETAETNLKLEFILLAIAKEEKLAASETEAQAFISKNVTDPKTLELLQKDPQAQSSLLYSLTKNKVVEFLKNL